MESIKLRTGQSHTNKTNKTQIVKIQYLNCFDEYQTDTQILTPGQTYSKTQSSTIIEIFI
jgi:hypothetical protein